MFYNINYIDFSALALHCRSALALYYVKSSKEKFY